MPDGLIHVISGGVPSDQGPLYGSTSILAISSTKVKRHILGLLSTKRLLLGVVDCVGLLDRWYVHVHDRAGYHI